MLRIWLLAWRKNSLTASDFPFWEYLVNSAFYILHFTFCILHFAFPKPPPISTYGDILLILHSAFCILHFSSWEICF